MGFLQGMKAYLSGPIDRAKDLGVPWRREITPHLEALGIEVIDPTNKPDYLERQLGLKEGETELMRINEYKKAGRWGMAEKLIQQVIHIDLRCVDISDLIIAYVPKDIVICGTMHEIVMAEIEKKPILVLCPGGKKNIHGWLLGLVGHRNIFSTQKTLIKRLESINNGRAKADDTRWLAWV